METILNVFNNREKALIIWLVIALALVLASKSIRPAFLAVLRALFARKIISALLIMLSYTSLVVFAAYKLHLWDISLLKDTIVWSLGTACIMFFNTNKVNIEKKYFQKVLLDNVKFVVFLEFLINLYVFNFFVELLFVPVLFFVGGLLAVSDTKKEYKPVKTLLQFIIAIYTVYIIIYAIVQVSNDFKDFATLYNLKDFLLAPVLTVCFLLFMYFLALYATYEALFTRLDIFSRDQSTELRRFTKRQILSTCLLNLKKLNKFSKNYVPKLMGVENKADVVRLTRQFNALYHP